MINPIKKLASVVVVAAMLISCFTMVGSALNGTPTGTEAMSIGVSLSASEVEPGDIVTVTVSASNNYNAITMRWPVLYSKAFFELVETEGAAVVTTPINSVTAVAGSTLTTQDASFIPAAYSAEEYNAFTIQWTAKGNTTAGVGAFSSATAVDCFTFQLRVKADASGTGSVFIPSDSDKFYYTGINDTADASTAYTSATPFNFTFSQAQTASVLSQDPCDYTALDLAIQAYSAVDLDTKTPASVTASDVVAKFNAAIAIPSGLLDRDNNQATINAVAQALNEAILALVDRADNSSLTDKLAAANAKVEADYTPASWASADLANVIAAAQAVANNGDATAAEIAAQVTAIDQAIAKLVAKANKVALKIAIDTLPAIAQADATPESWGEYETALAAAQAVYADANATQAAVDEAKNELIEKTNAVTAAAVAEPVIMAADGYEVQTITFLGDDTVYLCGFDITEILENNGDFRDQFVVENGSYEVSDEIFATGVVVTVYDSKGDVYAEYPIIFFGDVNGDGVIDGSDYDSSAYAMNYEIELENIYRYAADVVPDFEGDAQIDGSDVDRIAYVMNYEMPPSTISQTHEVV